MSYEVQADKNGKWVIESVQSDEDAAVYDAQLLLRGKSTMSVRVVQEIYNPNDDSYRIKAGIPPLPRSGRSRFRGR